MKFLLTNAVLVDVYAGTMEPGELAVCEGRYVGLDTVNDKSGWDVIDCEGAHLAPGFVDLHGKLSCWRKDSAAAVAGGFTTVALTADRDAVVDSVDILAAARAGAKAAACSVLVPGALTLGLEGKELAEMGRMSRQGAPFMSQGVQPVSSTLVLQGALEYAERLGLTVFLRGGDSELESGGVAKAGPWAVVHGLPAISAEAEEIGIHRVAALARSVGARVHLTHVWSARGVEALRRVKADTPSLTASTTLHHLALTQEALDPYSGQSRFHPPIGDADDRRALVGAVADGILVAVASDHAPHPPYLKDREFEDAAPGSVGFEVSFPMVLEALNGDVLAACRVLGAGPRSILGLPAQSFELGSWADLVMLDVKAAWTCTLGGLRASQKNTPLAGRPCTGRVEKTWVRGELVFDAC